MYFSIRISCDENNLLLLHNVARAYFASRTCSVQNFEKKKKPPAYCDRDKIYVCFNIFSENGPIEEKRNQEIILKRRDNNLRYTLYNIKNKKFYIYISLLS